MFSTGLSLNLFKQTLQATLGLDLKKSLATPGLTRKNGVADKNVYFIGSSWATILQNLLILGLATNRQSMQENAEFAAPSKSK